MNNTEPKSQCDCGCKGAGPLLTEFLRRLGPSEDVSQHFRTAHLEVLKGLRALLDEQIAARSETARKRTKARAGTKISVE